MRRKKKKKGGGKGKREGVGITAGEAISLIGILMADGQAREERGGGGKKGEGISARKRPP